MGYVFFNQYSAVISGALLVTATYRSLFPFKAGNCKVSSRKRTDIPKHKGYAKGVLDVAFYF